MDAEVRKVLGRGVEGFLGGRDGVFKFFLVCSDCLRQLFLMRYMIPMRGRRSRGL